MLTSRPERGRAPRDGAGHHRRAARHASRRGEGAPPGRGGDRQGLLAGSARPRALDARGAAALARAEGVRDPESAQLGRGRGRVRVPARARPRRRLRADPASGAGGQAPRRSGVDRVARAARGPRRDARPPLRVRHRLRARDRAERRPARGARQDRIAGRGRPRVRPQRVPGRRALLRARGRALAARRPRRGPRSCSSSLARTTSSPTNGRRQHSRRPARLPLATERVELAAEADALLAELWWFRGDRDACDRHLERAHAFVQDLPSSPGKARVLSQVSRYRMLAGAARGGDSDR